MIVLQEPAHSLAPLLTVVVEVEEDGLRGSLHVAEKSCINCDKYCEEERDDDLSDHFLYFNDCLLILELKSDLNCFELELGLQFILQLIIDELATLSHDV